MRGGCCCVVLAHAALWYAVAASSSSSSEQTWTLSSVQSVQTVCGLVKAIESESSCSFATEHEKLAATSTALEHKANDDGDDDGSTAEACARLYALYRRDCLGTYWETRANRVMSKYVAAMLLALLAGHWVLQWQGVLLLGCVSSILVGVALGLVYKTISANTLHPHFSFNEEMFFLALLPPIIMHTGHQIDKSLLMENRWTVFAFAIVGTVLAIATVALVVHSLSLVSPCPLPVAESVVFAALICSVDPVGVMHVFDALGVDAILHTLVLAEATLNNSVVLVAFDGVLDYLANPSLTLVEIVVGGLVMALASVLAGFATAMAASYLFRSVTFTNDKVEVLLFLLLSLLPFYMSGSVKISSVVALITSSVVMDMYTVKYLSTLAASNVRFVVSTLSRLCETWIYAYLGISIAFMSFTFSNEEKLIDIPGHIELVAIALAAVCISRVISVYGMAWLCNTFRSNPLPRNVQHTICVSGLRGVLSLALAANVPSFNRTLNEGTKYESEIITMTVSVVLACAVLSMFSPRVLGAFHAVHWQSRSSVVVRKIIERGGSSGTPRATSPSVASPSTVPSPRWPLPSPMTRLGPIAVTAKRGQGQSLADQDSQAFVHEEQVGGPTLPDLQQDSYQRSGAGSIAGEDKGDRGPPARQVPAEHASGSDEELPSSYQSRQSFPES